ncbi:MAG TPA: hypothetical protein VM754_01465, partial [Actinomycetota bacterium]|nr:hypothetical protein [Actinomycetota bacterium]
MATKLKERLGGLRHPGALVKGAWDGLRGGQVWRSMFRPGSIMQKGYQDSPRNRAYVIMNSVIYHLHP